MPDFTLATDISVTYKTEERERVYYYFTPGITSNRFDGTGARFYTGTRHRRAAKKIHKVSGSP